MLEADFALFNVGQLVTGAPGSHVDAEGALGVIRRGALAARDGKIVWTGRMDEFQTAVRLNPDSVVVNTHGQTVLPGFVDPHTHPVFAGNRAGDFYARTAGASYEDQLERGGIMQTVRATRAASEDELLGLALGRAGVFLRYGTTTIEGKSGYGLTDTDELKSLRVLSRLQRLSPLKVVPAFLGAHDLPDDAIDRDTFVADIIERWLPAARPYAGVCDAWCDPGAFSAEQCRRILTRARELGYELTLHANELAMGPGASLAAEMRCLSVDHAVYLDSTSIAALKAAGTVAVLLPGTTLFLGSDTYAPARSLLDAGVPVALGTDFNPGTSNTQNMQFILTLAVLKLGMTPEEAILGATREAARAVGLEQAVGALSAGKYCDFTTYSVDDYRLIPYHYAMNLVDVVVAGGQVVVRDGALVAEAPASTAVP
ncbi:MAG: imidazolonepropionase [Chloroflexota bacterium]